MGRCLGKNLVAISAGECGRGLQGELVTWQDITGLQCLGGDIEGRNCRGETLQHHETTMWGGCCEIEMLQGETLQADIAV